MTRWMMVVVALAVGACAFDADPTAPVVDEGFEHIVIDPGHEIGVGNTQVALPGDRIVPGIDSDPCQCTTNECLEDFVDQNFGCDLCVTLVCNSGPQHVCTVCGADDDTTDNGFNTNQP